MTLLLLLLLARRTSKSAFLLNGTATACAARYQVDINTIKQIAGNCWLLWSDVYTHGRNKKQDLVQERRGTGVINSQHRQGCLRIVRKSPSTTYWFPLPSRPARTEGVGMDVAYLTRTPTQISLRRGQILLTPISSFDSCPHETFEKK